MALQLLAIDPVGLKGLWLRSKAGPVRDRLLQGLHHTPLPRRKISPGIGDEALYGGLDVAGTFAGRRPAWSRGVLSEAALIVLPMAERASAGLGARLAHALDAPKHCLVAIDEGDEGLPIALIDRLGLFADLDGVAWGETEPIAMARDDLTEARQNLKRIRVGDEGLRDLSVAAAQLGIASLRAPLLAAAATRAHAALCRRRRVETRDLEVAASMVYAHRALPITETQPEDERQSAKQAETAPQDDATSANAQRPPDDVLVEAARASLPPDLLAELAAGRAMRAAKSSGGSGAAHRGNRRGRPLPSRPGRLDGTARIDLVATLRAAAPWQRLRRAASPRGQRLAIRAADIRLKRFEDKSDRLLIFAVDASGSSALARLAEAKGAVELLLAEAYARRDHVALVAFRGEGAEILLPPTRSLVQTKRRLAGLPGGGGTPLAAGLQAALQLGLQAEGRGMTPTIAVLTDGRANIALDGRPDRAAATEDSERLARLVRARHLPALMIDSANRPQRALQTLADLMGAKYIALPRADARRLSESVAVALEA